MEEQSKWVECISCVHFFDCKIREEKAEMCLNYQERDKHEQGMD